MDRVFWDENKSCAIDFSAAEWATDAIHDVFQSTERARDPEETARSCALE